MIDIKHVRDNEICQEYHVRADTKDIYLNMVYPYKTPFVKIDVPLLTKWMIAYSTETYNNYAAMITPYLAPICLTIAKAPTILTPSNVSSCVLTPIAHSVVPKTVTKYRALINNDKSALTASAPARVMSTDIKQPPVEYQLPPPLAPKITFVHVTPKEAAEKKLSPPRLVPSQPAKKREIEQEQSTARPQATLDEQLAYAVLCVDYGKKPDAEELNKLVTQNIESNPEDPRGANKKINNFSLDLNELESTAHRDKRQRAGAE
jgi:hypothetical protein